MHRTHQKIKAGKGKVKSQSALPYLFIDGEGAYYQKLIRATLLVAWGLQNQCFPWSGSASIKSSRGLGIASTNGLS